MAKKNPKTISDKKPKTSSYCLFLACFGSSHDVKAPHAAADSGGRRRIRWGFWSSRLRFKIKSAAKTVPIVDQAGLSEKPGSVDKIEPLMSKSTPVIKVKSLKSPDEKIAGKRQIPFSSRKPPSLSPVVPTAAAEQKSPKPKQQTQNTVPEKRGDSYSLNDKTGHKRRSFCRRIDAIRTGSISQPGSPVDHNKPPSKIGRTTSHPVASFPSVTNNYIKPASPSAKNQTGPDEIDPVMGMSIILVTLIIMLVWGRVCAILSTSAWFYFVPRLTKFSKSTSDNNRDCGLINGNSIYDDHNLRYEYKKRVVLQGFLDRTHRSV